MLDLMAIYGGLSSTVYAYGSPEIVVVVVVVFVVDSGDVYLDALIREVQAGETIF